MATLHQDALIFVFVLDRHGTRWNQIKHLLFFSSFRPEMEGKGWDRDLAVPMWLHNINSLWNYTTIRAGAKGEGPPALCFGGAKDWAEKTEEEPPLHSPFLSPT